MPTKTKRPSAAVLKHQAGIRQCVNELNGLRFMQGGDALSTAARIRVVEIQQRLKGLAGHRSVAGLMALDRTAFVEMGAYKNDKYEFEGNMPLFVDGSGAVWARIAESVSELPRRRELGEH